MKENVMQWFCEKRKNVHVKNNTEWALNISFNNEAYWTVATFASRPKEKDLKKIIEIIKRTCEIYHTTVVMGIIESFHLTIEDERTLKWDK